LAEPIASFTAQHGLLQLADLFDSLEEIQVWIKDREGRYQWVNRAFRLNFALTQTDAAPPDEKQIIGKTDYDLSPAFLADQFRLDDEYVLAGNRIANRIEQVSQPDGTNAWNITNKIPLADASGKTIGTAGLTRILKSQNSEIASGSEFDAVLAYLRDNYHTAISNHQLASRAHMSVRTFERKFRASFHMTPQKYLRKLQMRMAARALVYTNKPLAEVAMSCGFADQSHFSREFRAHFRRTPREYREMFAGK
jgi:AraC-like DNA-binding protein